MAAIAPLTGCDRDGSDPSATASSPTPAPIREDADLRVAAYNVSFFREEPGQLIADLRGGTDPQVRAVAEVIGAVSPDVLVLGEFDHDPDGEAIALFAERLGYPYALSLASNTGVPSGRDLDQDGRSDHPPGSRAYGGDAFGYGTFPGQYALAVMSRFPIDEAAVRTYRRFLWRDLPGNLLPTDYYDEGDARVLRLSSKTHAVVPVEAPGRTLNLVLAHPTPPGFDGAEDRNGRRNHDEVRLLEAIIDPDRSGVLRDDAGRPGGLAPNAAFVIAGDLNADPADGDPVEGAPAPAIAGLLAHPLVQDPRPRSSGGVAGAAAQGGVNTEQVGDPALDTADFSDGGAGNLRVDYLLPSSNLGVLRTGVFWPSAGEAGYALVGPGYPVVSSDHRLVWADLRLAPDTPGEER